MSTSLRNNKNRTASRVATGALFTALAFTFSYFEFLLPSIGIPGVKLGLANLIIVIALYILGPKYAYIINVCRIVLAGLMFSGLFALVYSLAGGLISLTVMCLLMKTGLFSVAGVSMAGAVAHNFGQILVASIVVENIRMFVYFPVLILSGIISGLLIGFIAHFTLKRLKKMRGQEIT